MDHSIENISLNLVFRLYMNRRSLFLCLLFFGSWSSSPAQEKLIKQNLEDEVTIKIPASFIPMNENDMWQRVSSYRKSLALYTDLDRLVELGVNRSYSVWEEGDYTMMLDVYKSSILELFDEVEFIRNEIVTRKRKSFVVFEFVSRIKSDEGSSIPIVKYTNLQYALHNGQTMVFSFSCPEYQMDKWQETANSIMNSIVLK